MEEKEQRAFLVLVDGKDAPTEVLVKVLKAYPSLLDRVTGTDQAVRYLMALSREGDVEGLEQAWQHSLITSDNALYYLRDALLRRPQSVRTNATEAQKVITEDYGPDGPDAELQVVDWLLSHFAFAPDEVDKIVADLPAPSENLRRIDVLRFNSPRMAPLRELPSFGTIVLLTRKQPMGQAARTKLLNLLGYAASDDFLSYIESIIGNLNIEDDSFWRQFPILRRLSAIMRRFGENFYFIPWGLGMPEATASRYERFLEEIGWFIRTYQAKYGFDATEKGFEVSTLSTWLACASCYAHEFGNTVHGATQRYFGAEIYQPRVGEFFITWGHPYEVVRVTMDEKGIVTEFEAAPYPRKKKSHGEIVSKMRLSRNGEWVEAAEAAKKYPRVPDIKWGEFIPPRK